jgi:glycosyltransferase involved in cell wall biosynthesis
VEKRIARQLSAVVAVTEDMGERFRRFQPNVAVVRNLPPAGAPLDLSGERGPVVIYAGQMNVARGLDILYDTARLVHQRHPEARFEILGPIEWHEIDPDLVQKSPAEWEAVGVRFLGSVPYPEVAPRLARAAIGWLPRSPNDLNNLLAWPNKLVEYMAAGLPIVASDLPTQASVIAEADCGVVVDAVSPGAHADAICDLLDNPAMARRLGDAGLEASQTKFTWESDAQKLHTLYKQLWRSGGPVH